MSIISITKSPPWSYPPIHLSTIRPPWSYHLSTWTLRMAASSSPWNLAASPNFGFCLQTKSCEIAHSRQIEKEGIRWNDFRTCKWRPWAARPPSPSAPWPPTRKHWRQQGSLGVDIWSRSFGWWRWKWTKTTLILQARKWWRTWWIGGWQQLYSSPPPRRQRSFFQDRVFSEKGLSSHLNYCG